jgi:putative two-component system response regulator
MTEKQTILAVDDTVENLDIIKGILVPDYTVLAATSGELALKIAQMKKPDLILLDVMMPGMDGYEVCRRLKADPALASIPVVFVTAMTAEQDEYAGFSVGAVDYLTKPVNALIVKARVKTHLSLADQQRVCESRVRQATAELMQNQYDAIEMLGDAGHYNDTDTGVHIWRMADYAELLARAINWPVDEQKKIKLAAPMHDTGKIGISDDILKAQRKLTPEEFEIMKTHTSIGYRILQKSNTPLFQMAAEIALRHHEKWNGAGYPDGLKGEDIPMSARIVAVADVFDALTMKRPYKEAWPIEKAFELLAKDAGSHFDPNLVEVFASIKHEVLEIKAQWDKKGD